MTLAQKAVTQTVLSRLDPDPIVRGRQFEHLPQWSLETDPIRVEEQSCALLPHRGRWAEADWPTRFTIPTNGHDFSGNTRYRISLTVVDSDGLTSTRAVTIYPDKVNLTFDSAPSGLTLYLDGIARITRSCSTRWSGSSTPSRHTTRPLALVATRSHPGPMAALSTTSSVCPAPPELRRHVYELLDPLNACIRTGQQRHASGQPEPGKGDVQRRLDVQT